MYCGKNSTPIWSISIVKVAISLINVYPFVASSSFGNIVEQYLIEQTAHFLIRVGFLIQFISHKLFIAVPVENIYILCIFDTTTEL